MKKTLLMMLVAAGCISVNAQKVQNGKGTGFSIGIEGGIPVSGNSHQAYSHLLGGSLQYEAKPAHDLGITLNGGYVNYGLKDSYGDGSIGFIPVMAGFKYYFSPVIFTHGQLGAAFGTDKDQKTAFTYSPGVGFNLTPNIDAELKYIGLSTKGGGDLNSVGLRIGYNF